MATDHRMEFMKALREHGQTIQKLAAGGFASGGTGPTMTAMPATQTPAPTPAAAGPTALSVNGPSSAGAGTPSVTTGMMQPINELLGTQSNFQATGANLQAGTNAAQLNQAYNQAQQGIGNQQDFLNALTAQNGIQNQNDVYNRILATSEGRGPNPAQAMLNQQTGQNVANQAALMAGTRGAGNNAGLIARQAAQQGAQTQQNAIGQGAALQAQQSQNAINQAAQIAQNQVNQQGQAIQGLNTAVQNEQNTLQGANSAFNTANVSNQANLNNVNAQISQGNQAAGNGLTGGIISGISSAVSSLFAEGGEVEDVGEAEVGGGNYTAPTSNSNAPNIGSMAASPDEGAAFKDAFKGSSGSGGGGGGGMLGGMMGGGSGGGGGIMSMLPMLAALNKGGYVPSQPVQKYAYGAIVTPMMGSSAAGIPQVSSGPKSALAQHLNSMGSSAAPNIGQMDSGNTGGGALGSAFQGAIENASKQSGSKDQTDDEAREGYLDADAKLGVSGVDNREVMMPASNDMGGFEMAARGGRIGDRLKAGGHVPGKPKVGGRVNTEKNDTVPALLSPGEVVLPRSVTKSKDPVSAAAKFMEALIRKQGKKAA